MNKESSRIMFRTKEFNDLIRLNVNMNDSAEIIFEFLNNKNSDYISFYYKKEIFIYSKEWFKRNACLKIEEGLESDVVLEAERIIKNLS